MSIDATTNALIDSMLNTLDGVTDDDFLGAIVSTSVAMLVGAAAEMDADERKKLAAYVAQSIISASAEDAQ